jgi:malate synthase
MTTWVDIGGLRVADALLRFVAEEALPGSGIEADVFWAGAEALLTDFTPRNRDLLATRQSLQRAIDEYHREAPGAPAEPAAYVEFLRAIGYLSADPEPFEINTSATDPEVGELAGPQLVVPLLNARFAINAANGRWGSLYDALYGTDVIDEANGRDRAGAYNPVRGAAVIAWARGFLDEFLPLQAASHVDVTRYSIDPDGLLAVVGSTVHRLSDPSALIGFQGEPDAPEAILLVHHGLHIEIQIDPCDPVGATDRAGVKDVLLEAAVSTIMDLEDSVAAVDAEEKVLGYRNWLQLMQGRLTAPVEKGGRTFMRTMADNRTYCTRDGKSITLPGRSLLFIRQVGLLMTTDIVLGADGEAVPEGLLDALFCGLASLHDLRGDSDRGNTRTGSVYVVKPKLHGPAEVEFTVDVFARLEELFGLVPGTFKIGIMDEERRTSANLRACIKAARERIAFINTGFLDRTGDEIHTSMQAGAMVRKADMRTQPWILAYEDNNVDAGLACGFAGRAQIGKGMWAAPDNMADMLKQKIGHPWAGATCAWVPSPTAATLHALHYHRVDVAARQRELTGREPVRQTDLLTIPLASTIAWTPEEIAAELDNNVQGLLGYVVRWIDAGVGCSKVPDIHGTPLMEDRATCRISSQHVSNWLRHGIVEPEQVERTLRRMAVVVDDQNSGNPSYRPMAPSFEGAAFTAARALLFDGIDQPSGYTEPILHARRRALKELTEARTR